MIEAYHITVSARNIKKNNESEQSKLVINSSFATSLQPLIIIFML